MGHNISKIQKSGLYPIATFVLSEIAGRTIILLRKQQLMNRF
jgi:hypothetical protein